MSFRKVNPLVRNGKLYTEEHHIIPSCLGGSDDPENLIRLTAREHFIAHRLLAKIHLDSVKLAYAVFLMSQQHQDRKICSREYARLRKLVSEDTSKRTRQLWKDPEHRAMMAEVTSKSLTELWEGPEHRSMMVEAISKATKQRWEDPEYKEKMGSQSKQLWEDPIYRAKMQKARSEWFQERKGCPWLMRPSKKEIWSLSQVFWEHNRNNPNAIETYSIEKFCKIFNEGKNKDIFAEMYKKFVRDNWIPNLDPNWMKEFGHIRF